jgi:chemotaxis protein MotB
MATGCVSAGKYDAAVQDAHRAQLAHTTEREQLNQRLGEVSSQLDASKNTSAACRKSLDDVMSLNDALRQELARRGQDVDQLTAAKGSLATALDETRARLEELRRARAAAEQRAAIFRDLALRLKRMVDSGNLSIVLRSGRMVLVMPTDVLFDSGKAQVKRSGEDALAQVAEALKTVEGRRFQVAGHTDNEPIRVSGFSSNWELSVARAVKVVEFLVEKGMRPDAVSAAGYGEFDAVSPNDTAGNRARNRRIEITLQANIDETVALP